jgi:hypothetical protein
VGAVVALEAWRARRLTRPHPAEARLIRALHTHDHVLHDLTVDLGVVGHRRFAAGQLSLLLLGANRDAALPPRVPPLLASGVVDLLERSNVRSSRCAWSGVGLRVYV